MEYSVADLIKILLKKWYIILLAMVAIGGISIYTAKVSYEKALSDYEAYTSQTVPAAKTGTLSATISYEYDLLDISAYVQDAQEKMDFVQQFSEAMNNAELNASIDSYADAAYAQYTAALGQLPLDSRIVVEIQNDIANLGYMEPPVVDEQGQLVATDLPLTVANHLTVTPTDFQQVVLTVTGLEEEHARTIVKSYETYLQEIAKTYYQLQLQFHETTTSFALDSVQYTETAQFAQTVMQKPEQKPILIKTVGTAAIYAFALACLAILLVTFVRDSHKSAAMDK